ncbi:MAG: phenylalanine--tRNA ligase subunit alpha [bacterium]
MIAPLAAQLAELSRQATFELEQVKNPTTLEQWRVDYLGRKGAIPKLLREIKYLSLAEKRVIGKQGNALRQKLERLHQVKRKKIKSAIPDFAPSGLSPAQPLIGHLHPFTLATRRIQQIFSAMGFLVVEGPEVEEARYNFDQLNIPFEHPARAETDTFYIQEQGEAQNLVLRTHTSPVQLRAVLENDLIPPFRILSPGRVFRAERTDATHETTFYQFEGLVVGDNISIADFKGTIETFYKVFFQKQVSTRLRPAYFPFVEPGFEVDISCTFCRAAGCRACKNTGWVEVMGAGMVHPNVLKNMNVNPKKYQGFAFGQSIDRIVMLQHGIDDIRLFWSGDIRLLTQFS